MASDRRAIVVGSGPAGYTAAIYLARAGLEPLVLEGTELGGALMTTGAVENFPGFDTPILGPELVARMRNQAMNVGAQLATDWVTKLDLTPGNLLVETARNSYRAEAVILAMGAEAKMLGIPEESWAVGAGLASCATCDGAFYRGQSVAVVGGGDAALEDAIYLAEICPDVTLIHRRDELRATAVLQDRAAALGVKFKMNSVVTGLVGEGRVTGVQIDDVTGGRPQTIAATALFVAIGQAPRTTLVDGQVDLAATGHVIVEPTTAMTKIPGVFACGDLVDAHHRQAITAAASGCVAALGAQRWISTRVLATGGAR